MTMHPAPATGEGDRLQSHDEDLDLGLICPCCHETLEIQETASLVFECHRCGAVWNT